MKKLLTLLLLLSLILGCKSTAGKTSDAQNTSSEYGSQEDQMKYYFTGTGNEPFWGIKMGNENIEFTSLISGKENLLFLQPKS